MNAPTRRSVAQLLPLALLSPAFSPALAQDKPVSPPAHPALPAEVVTRHSIGTGEGVLSFRARAGAIPIRDAATNATTAELTYIAYETGAEDPATRPIVFVMNGGPGATSAWLGLGAVGPWRLRMDGAADVPSAEPRLIENAETWLPFADLVLIDTPGTGFSWAREPAQGSESARVYSVDGDIEALATFIREWLTAHGRLLSPKYILAESYGGIRAPRLARRMSQQDNVGIRGLFLVSPLLDVSAIEGPDLLVDVARLPAYTAINRHAASRAALADVEAYARSEFLVDLLKGPRDAAAQARLAKRVSALVGLSEDYVRTSGGRVDRPAFIRELRRASGKVLSNYDGTVAGWDPAPNDYYSVWDDPMLDNLRAPIGAAMTSLVTDRLQWPATGPFQVLNYAVARRWDWGKAGRRSLESMTALRSCLASDPTFRVSIVHGLNDMATPYFATQLLLDSLPSYGSAPRATLATYAGGHMLYSDDAARRGMRDEGRALIAATA